MDNGDLTSYVQAASGFQTVTVSGTNGYIYIQKMITIRAGSASTVAIINTSTGLDLMEISDLSCNDHPALPASVPATFPRTLGLLM